MMLNHQIFFAALFVGLLAGCGTSREKIVFSDDRTQLPANPAAVVVAMPKKLDRQDLSKIELVVFGYLLQRHFWDNHDYSAVFIQGDADEADALLKQFPRHVPPVKTLERAELKPNRAPVDRDTGRPAMLLSMDALDPMDNSVEAVGKWYAGDAVTGFYTFSLRKIGGDWVIESVK
jgi:hypothetical protein